MAKELPYFQFEPAEYMSGSIQFCSLAAQGLFVNIMCLYWQRNCELTTDQINKRFNVPELLNELINHQIIKVSVEKIEIIFLKRSYKKHLSIARKNSVNGKISAEKKRIKRSQAVALSGVNDRSTTVDKPLQRIVNEPSTSRREENREEEKRIEKRTFSKPTVEELEKYFTEKAEKWLPEKVKNQAEKFFNHYQANGWKVGKNSMKSWQAAVSGWISRDGDYNSNNGAKEREWVA